MKNGGNMRTDAKRAVGIKQRKEPIRLIGLSDGLFATVLTLLVLDLRVPETFNTAGNTIELFIKYVGPRLFSYLLTFLVAGTYWMTHHRDFDYIEGYDRSLLGYNLLFLLFIGLLPFSTAAVSPINLRNGVYPFYWAIYAANVSLAGIMLTLTWNYAVSHGLLKHEVTARQIRHIVARQLVIPVIFLVSIVIQYLSAQRLLGPYVLLLIPICLMLIDRVIHIDQPKGRVAHSRIAGLLWRIGTSIPWLLVIGLAIWAMSI
jgi:uncharacterized membrane protein